MKARLLCLLLALPLLAFAQLVPLTLDQTITMPNATIIWDVMPDTAGNYLWVQAVQPDTASTTRVYWGRTDSAGVDSFDLDVGFPVSIMCFWRDGHQPHILLETRAVFQGYQGFETDSSTFCIYRLADGSPSIHHWLWIGSVHGPYGENVISYSNYKLACVIPNPAPPDVSEHLTAAIVYDAFWSDHGAGPRDPFVSVTSRGAQIIIDALADTSAILRLFDYAGFTSWATYEDDCFLSVAGALTYSYTSSGGETTVTYGGKVRSFHVDSAQLSQESVYFHSCDANHPADCAAYQSCSTYDTLLAVAAAAGRVGTITYAMNSSLDSGTVWSTGTSYFYELAADVVEGNGAEEFLCYDNTRLVFDVLGAADGHNYGVTDTITLGGEPRIIGRYDSTSRRLAFRIGNQLKLYRFGEYLAADDGRRPTQVNEYILSAYPNPFNPTTQISFTLPRSGRVQISIFDVTGRNVKTLLDEHFVAGEHRVSFDGTALPSGVYFARLSAGSVNRTEKLLLLK
jgi:hypothetical protein